MKDSPNCLKGFISQLLGNYKYTDMWLTVISFGQVWSGNRFLRQSTRWRDTEILQGRWTWRGAVVCHFWLLSDSFSYCGGMIKSNSWLCLKKCQIVSTQLKQLQREQDKDDQGLAARALEQVIERTEANIQWVKENKDIVKEWFNGEL